MTGYEQEAHRAAIKSADALERIAKALEALAQCVNPGMYGGKVEWDATFRVQPGDPK